MAKTDTADTAAADAAAKAAADTAAADKATADKAAADKATVDKAAADKVAADLAAGKKPEGAEGAKEGDEAGKGGAPEKYALTLPEGGMIDASELAAFEKMARRNNLPNEAAQTALEQANEERIENSEALAAQLTADPDYGGAKLAETQRLAKIGIAAIRPEGHPRRAAFMRILDTTGYGNHIEIASAFADLGKKMAEDVPVPGAGGAGGDRSNIPLAKRMYPGMK